MRCSLTILTAGIALMLAQFGCPLDHPALQDSGRLEGAVTCLDDNWQVCDVITADGMIEAGPDASETGADTNPDIKDADVEVADAAEVMEDAAEVSLDTGYDVSVEPPADSGADSVRDVLSETPPLDSGVDSGRDVPVTADVPPDMPVGPPATLRIYFKGRMGGNWVGDYWFRGLDGTDGGLTGWSGGHCSGGVMHNVFFDGENYVELCVFDPTGVPGWDSRGLPGRTVDFFMTFLVGGAGVCPPSDYPGRCETTADFLTRVYVVLNGTTYNGSSNITVVPTSSVGATVVTFSFPM